MGKTLKARENIEYDEDDFKKKRLYITQLCLWTSLLCFIPLFPRFMNIADWYSRFSICVLVGNLISSAACGYGLFSTLYVQFYGATNHETQSQNRITDIHIQMRYTRDPRKLRRLEKQEARTKRTLVKQQRKNRKKTPYDALQYCLPYILIFPITMGNLIFIVVFIVAFDKDPMRAAKYIILIMTTIWIITAPFVYLKLVNLYNKQLCRPMAKTCCSSSSSEITVNEDEILQVDDEYFQKHNPNNVDLDRQLSLY